LRTAAPRRDAGIGVTLGEKPAAQGDIPEQNASQANPHGGEGAQIDGEDRAQPRWGLFQFCALTFGL
jgi:hypothetical protein